MALRESAQGNSCKCGLFTSVGEAIPSTPPPPPPPSADGALWRQRLPQLTIAADSDCGAGHGPRTARALRIRVASAN